MVAVSTSGIRRRLNAAPWGRSTMKIISWPDLTISRALGHGRYQVTPSYYGTYGHALRVPPALVQIKAFQSEVDGIACDT
jgi:hypothetical protein